VIPATQTPPFGNPGAFWLDNPPVLRPKKKGSSKREGPPWEFSTRKEKAPTPGWKGVEPQVEVELRQSQV